MAYEEVLFTGKPEDNTKDLECHVNSEVINVLNNFLTSFKNQNQKKVTEGLREGWGECENSEMRTDSQRKHFFWCFLAPKTKSSPFSTQVWGTAPLSCVRHRFIEFKVTFSVFRVFIVLKHIFNPSFKQFLPLIDQ